MTIASTTKPPESPHEKAPGRFFRVFTSLLLRLGLRPSLLTLSRMSKLFCPRLLAALADVVAITVKAVNSIQINNLRPVDAHEVLKTLRV